MKKLLVSSLLAWMFIGCGSTSVDSGAGTDTGKTPQENGIKTQIPTGFTGYVLYDYLLPASQKEVKTYKYKNNVLASEERLAYTQESGLTTQRSLRDIDGQVEYRYSGQDDIAVSIYHDSVVEKFNLKNFVNLNDMITLKTSTCKVSAHYDIFKAGEQSFSDVLALACPKSIGYYEKGNGLVLENVIEENLQTSAFEPAKTYPDRKIGMIDGYEPNKLGALNLQSAQSANVDKLWAAPYNLNGAGMKIGLVDGGAVLASHTDLRGRVTNLSQQDTNLHATHVAGTLISSGRHLYDARGFANQAEIYSLYYNDIAFSKSIKKLFSEYGILISNHSYGYPGSEGLGEYDGVARDLDIAVRENPYLIAVMAAGNDGKEYKNDSAFTKWGITKGGANAKNVITVAALADSGKIAYFSSPGPIKGGRLKPDISIDGSNVLSTSNHDDTAYTRMWGTSMASPAATGTIALLSQRYSQVNADNVRLDTMKAILFNTARDIENPGPDFKSGFGRIDALKAVKVIDTMRLANASLVTMDKIYQGQKQEYFINAAAYQNFKVTLAWVDDTYQNCNNCANDMLINDIDMYLVEERSGKKVYPYTLSEDSPASNAIQTKENHIDPQEQVAFSLRPGNYTLHLAGKKISSKGQDFTLVSTIPFSQVQKDIVLRPMNEHIHKIYNAIK